MNIKLLLTIVSSSLFFVIAENHSGGKKINGGDAFRKTATEHSQKAANYEKLANKKGAESNPQTAKYTKLAAYYKRMAEIKIQAAKLADQGKWDEISWDEYHAINKKLVEAYKSKSKENPYQKKGKK